MKIRIQTDMKVNVKSILNDCIIHVSDDELKREIKGIVSFWAEQRLLEDGWPRPNSAKAIRDYLMENGIIGDITEDQEDF
ncbi:hypothetical protein SAMN03159341_102504 [Paenibacillus sp. 1_12]|uniref:hypothetical protein n=1 Tax=Paenibacillus sp. 1_12 TaxID=1566278 RepID=UPI0008EBE814|nr:hypothetical protein [Paenibacillus sp. 1_12]SFK97772.1 hypothetical protein SAMN03159341_102504 [Paenibacillus sp. 1_12]